MKTVSKALLGTIAAGAMVASSATPALADHRNDNGISVGEVIAGALIIGGIAAVVSSASKNDRGYNRGYGDDYGYNRGGYSGDYGNNYDRNSRYNTNPRQAVEQCVYAAERYASNRSLRANVTQIREVRDTRYGYQVKGTIVTDGGNRGWQRGYNDNYGQNWGNNQGWNNRGYNTDRGYDDGSFKCKFERGQITDLDLDGIRGL